MNYHSYQDYSDFVDAAVGQMVDVCAAADERVHVALSGGSTPAPVYEAFAQRTDIDLTNVSLWQVDERYVSDEDPDSNAAMIRQNLESSNSLLKAFHTFDTTLPIDHSLAAYEDALQSNLANGLDLTVLGVGPDGHTASLFPGSQALFEESRWVVHTITERFTVRDRLTITFPLIMQSRKLLVLMRGQDKASILDELKSGTKKTDEFPARRLLNHQDLTIIFCDC